MATPRGERVAMERQADWLARYIWEKSDQLADLFAEERPVGTVEVEDFDQLAIFELTAERAPLTTWDADMLGDYRRLVRRFRPQQSLEVLDVLLKRARAREKVEFDPSKVRDDA